MRLLVLLIPLLLLALSACGDNGTQPYPTPSPAPCVHVTPPRVPEPGTVFPFLFAADDIHGNGVTFDDIGAFGLYFVYFWTTWCPSCVAGMPGLIGLAEEFGDRVGFVTLLGDFDNRNAAVAITEGAPFLTLDANDAAFGELMAQMHTGFVPTSALFDAYGNMLGEPIIGSGEAVFRARIQEALGG